MKVQVGLAAVACFALAGCISAGVAPFTTPDGKPGYIAYCGGKVLGMADCHAEARKTCQGDYVELNRSVTTRNISNGGSTENRSFEFTCL